MVFLTLADIEQHLNIVFSDKISDKIEILSIFNGTYVETEDTFKNKYILIMLGVYYQDIVKDYVAMEKYYLMAIDLGSSNAMFNLAHYQSITKNYVAMEKYLLMAIDLGDVNAMFNLGDYHQGVTRNYVAMEKYYLMAIDQGNSGAMSNLGYYYFRTDINYVKMEKYLLMAIELNNDYAMCYLGEYHRNITRNYKEMEKYYLMALDLGNIDIIYKLNGYYDRDKVKLFNFLDLHYESKNIHNEMFLNIYNELLQQETVITYIKSNIDKCLEHKIFLNEYLYNKYVIINTKCMDTYVTDFTIYANIGDISKEYYVHSLVLNSAYFSNLIDGDFRKCKQVTMYPLSFHVIELLLKYLYLNELDYKNIDTDDMESLKSLADEFQFTTLYNAIKWINKLSIHVPIHFIDW
jgi:TPR repeat protein